MKTLVWSRGKLSFYSIWWSHDPRCWAVCLMKHSIQTSNSQNTSCGPALWPTIPTCDTQISIDTLTIVLQWSFHSRSTAFRNWTLSLASLSWTSLRIHIKLEFFTCSQTRSLFSCLVVFWHMPFNWTYFLPHQADHKPVQLRMSKASNCE